MSKLKSPFQSILRPLKPFEIYPLNVICGCCHLVMALGTGLETSWRNFVRILSKVLLKTLIDIVPSYNNEIIHVFIVLLNYCLPKHLLTIAKSFAIVFKIPATPIHCSLTFQPSFVLQSTIGGFNIFLMDMNYHYWIHPYQFCIQRTKNCIKNISILSYQQIHFFQTKPNLSIIKTFFYDDLLLSILFPYL